MTQKSRRAAGENGGEPVPPGIQPRMARRVYAAMKETQPPNLDQAIDCPPRETKREHLPSRENPMLACRKIADRPLDELPPPPQPTRVWAIFATYSVVNIAHTRHWGDDGGQKRAGQRANQTKAASARREKAARGGSAPENGAEGGRRERG